MRFSKHKLLLAGVDVFIFSAEFGLAFWFVFRSGLYGDIRPFPGYFVPSLLLLVVIFVSAFQLEGLYKFQAVANPIHQLQKLFKCYLRVFGTFIVLVFFMKMEYIADSRFTIGLGFLISFFAPGRISGEPCAAYFSAHSRPKNHPKARRYHRRRGIMTLSPFFGQFRGILKVD
jgi:hypothetical protein